MSTAEQRTRWRRRATWVNQLGLADGESVPHDVAEELAEAVLVLLAELEHGERARG